MDRYITTLKSFPPYDFDLTASYATYFQGRYAADLYRNGVFRRLLDVDGRPCLIKIRSIGTSESPELSVVFEGAGLSDRAVFEAQNQTARLMGVDQDPRPFYLMAREDPLLERLIQRLVGLHIPQTVSVWEALVFAILGQQISSHVARLLRMRFVRTYGLAIEDSGSTYHTFPRPEVISEAGVERLQTIKMSKKKAEYITDIAEGIMSGRLDLENLQNQSDEEIVHSLTSIRGVGSWTASWLLIRAFGRPDAFPAGDLALRRTLMHLLKKEGPPVKPEDALKISQRWSPFRSYVTTYIFAAIRSDRFPELSRTGSAEL